MLVSRSSFEKPKPFERLVRTSSPSSTSTRWPRLRNSSASRFASVDFPDPDRPVNHKVKPSLIVLLKKTPVVGLFYAIVKVANDLEPDPIRVCNVADPS